MARRGNYLSPHGVWPAQLGGQCPAQTGHPMDKLRSLPDRCHEHLASLWGFHSPGPSPLGPPTWGHGLIVKVQHGPWATVSHCTAVAPGTCRPSGTWHHEHTCGGPKSPRPGEPDGHSRPQALETKPPEPSTLL